MSAINITNARKELYNLVEDVNLYSEPTLIAVSYTHLDVYKRQDNN